MTDYRALLVKYMRHLLYEEGYTFVERASSLPPVSPSNGEVQFTCEEITVLEQAEHDARNPPEPTPETAPRTAGDTS